METEAERDRGSKSGVFRRLALATGAPMVELRLSEPTEQDMSGIPVMDDDNLNVLDALVEQARKAPPSRESAPVSVRDRLALAREMLVRAAAELEAVIPGLPATDRPKEAREAALEGVAWLDSELAD